LPKNLDLIIVSCFLQNGKIWRAVATPVFDVFIVMIALQKAIMTPTPLGYPAPFLFMLPFITSQLYIGTSAYMTNGLTVFPEIKWAAYLERWIYGQLIPYPPFSPQIWTATRSSFPVWDGTTADNERNQMCRVHAYIYGKWQ